MAVTETIKSSAYRVWDAASSAWKKYSFWTKSSDVAFNDGKNAEAKLGVIDGITDSTTATSSRIAASAKALSDAIIDLRQSFQDGCNTIVSACTTYGVTPASNSPADIAAAIGQISNTKSDTYTWNFSANDTIPTSLSFDTGKGNKLIGAAVTAMKGIYFYRYGSTNNNHYAPGSVTTSCEDGVANVYLGPQPTNQNEYREPWEASLTITYWYNG
ncbi:MAG: hypothetical protein Q4C58_14140 [Eubacteriales bacterium]|nr:hypothetical protein [Eubacteriales bacterium]